MGAVSPLTLVSQETRDWEGKGRTKAGLCKRKGLLGRAQQWEYSDMGISAVTLSALELLAAFLPLSVSLHFKKNMQELSWSRGL